MLELELWRVGTTPDKALVGAVVTGLKRGLGHITMFTLGLITTDVHDALVAADAQADQVIECVIESDDISINADPASNSHTTVTVEPGELTLQPGEATLTTGDDAAPSSATVQPETIPAQAEVRTPRIVTGQATGDFDLEATARGQTHTLGTAVERDEALPVASGASGSRSMPPAPPPADVTGEVAATASDNVPTAEGTALPPTIVTTADDRATPPSDVTDSGDGATSREPDEA